MNRRRSLLGLLAVPLLAPHGSSARAAVSAPSALNEAPPMPRFPAADLLADAALLRRAYDALHPGLLRYNTPADMDGHYAALDASLSRGATLAEAYLAFSVFAAKVRCGHTYANFFNQTRVTSALLFERPDRVPFQFAWLDRRMIVTRNLSSDASLVPGTEVVAIGGIPASTILERLMTIARADGGNDAKRVAWLQVQGEESIEAFDVFLPLFFPAIGRRQVLLVRSPEGSAPRTTTVDALTAEGRRATRAAVGGDGAGAGDASAESGWTLDARDPALAVLRMPTWAMYNSRWDWKAWLQRAFDTLADARAPALAIDLRANEGGDDVGDLLLAHLVDEPLPLRAMRRLVRYRRVPEDLAPFLDTWDPSFKDWGAAARPFDGRFLRLTRFDDGADGDLIAPRPPRYRGRVFVLVGATNSSATFEFAQRVKDAGLATLVGQPTGGNRRGINGGAFFFLRLPKSGIELDLPLIGQFPVGDLPPDEGVIPDVRVERSVADVAAGIDAEMRAVRRLAVSSGR